MVTSLTDDAPGPPLAGVRVLVVAPEGLVGVDHPELEHHLAQRPIGRLEVSSKDADLVPERLAVGVQSRSAHGFHLALERHVVEVLLLGDMDREVDGVATARDELRRSRRRHHLLVAPAAILLPAVLEDLVLDADDGDLLGLFGLVAHLGEGLAADRAGPIVFFESVGDLFDGEIRLAFRAVASPRCLGLSLVGLLVARSSLGGLAEDLALHCGELFFEQLELHLRIGILTLQTGDLGAETSDLFRLSDGGFFKVRCDLLEGLDVVDFFQPRHDLFSQ